MTIASPVYAGPRPLSVWSGSRAYRPGGTPLSPSTEFVVWSRWRVENGAAVPDGGEVAPYPGDFRADAAALVARLTAGDRGDA